MPNKKSKEVLKEYMIDYDMFTIEEVIKIVSFFKLIEDINKKKRCNKEDAISKYNEYRTILNNKALEKQYDKMLEKESGVSIYKTMKEIMGA